jgi:hypothetical protein
MGTVNVQKLFGDCFRESDEAATALAKTLSRLRPEEREKTILEVCQATGMNVTFWRTRIQALGSKKK